MAASSPKWEECPLGVRDEAHFRADGNCRCDNSQCESTDVCWNRKAFGSTRCSKHQTDYVYTYGKPVLDPVFEKIKNNITGSCRICTEDFGLARDKNPCPTDSSHCNTCCPCGNYTCPNCEEVVNSNDYAQCDNCGKCTDGCCECFWCEGCDSHVENTCDRCERCTDNCCECARCNDCGEAFEYTCSNCDECDSCCDCAHCDKCGDAKEEVCENCDNCDGCCDCVHCSNCDTKLDRKDRCDECYECSECCDGH